MTLIIPNADKTLLDILKSMNKKLETPYTLIEKQDSVSLDKILNSYKSSYSYEEIKEDMDICLKDYLEGNKSHKTLGTGWN